MPLSTNLHSYDDVRAVLDAALSAGGGNYTLETSGQAIYWRARAYYFRKLLQNLEKERYEGVPGMAASTPYDHLKLGLEKGSRTVTIEIMKPQGILTDRAGNRLDIAMPVTTDEDEEALFEQAEQLKKELGL